MLVISLRVRSSAFICLPCGPVIDGMVFFASAKSALIFLESNFDTGYLHFIYIMPLQGRLIFSFRSAVVLLNFYHLVRRSSTALALTSLSGASNVYGGGSESP
jgi:hypothetical protein